MVIPGVYIYLVHTHRVRIHSNLSGESVMYCVLRSVLGLSVIVMMMVMMMTDDNYVPLLLCMGTKS